jgi:uncharacterized PurR-regulated membrane protein YhhQ (DUF165 family)
MTAWQLQQTKIACGFGSVVGLMSTVVAANWAIEKFGMVSVGFGLVAPAGVYFAGLAFILRDFIHETLGTKAVLVAIAGGSLLSMSVSPTFAIASGAAFLFSEMADLIVYAPIRRRHWLGAVIVSNLAGGIVDSALFLWLAFGSLQFLAGQVVGKFWITGAFVALVWGWRYVVSERISDASSQ